MKSQISNIKYQKKRIYIKTSLSEGPAARQPQIVLAPSASRRIRCGALWCSPSSRHPFLGLLYNSLTINSKLRTRILFFLLFILIFAFCSLNLRKACAQTLSLSISPPILEVLIRPGKSITQAYKIVNNGEATVVTGKMVEFTENGIKENKDFVPESWISVVSPGFSFNQPFFMTPGAEKQIVLRINPPVGTLEQDFYRALVFTTTPSLPSEYSQSSASITIGSILLIRTSTTGMIPLGAQIAEFVLPSVIDSFGPLETTIDIRNTGKTYFRPLGTISLMGPVGKGKYDINPGVIFAGRTKRITAQINNQPDKTLSLSGFFLGKYQLGVSFTLDEGTIKIEQTRTFYAVPWKAGLGILAFLFLMSIMYRRKRRKKHK